MKKRGVLNAELNAALSRLGHMDLVMVTDCGMPAPRGVPVVDLALIQGVPRLEQVLDALLDELEIEGCVAARELKSTVAEAWLTTRFDHIEYISHAELKELSTTASLIVRTGEATPYANVALICGVPF